MSDNAMLALDSTLSTIFRQRLGASSTAASTATSTTKPASKKATTRAARATVVHFKTRVLALLSLYLRHHHASPLSLNTILPLLMLIRTTRSAHLSSGASKALLDVYFPTAKKKGLPVLASGHDEAERVWELLKGCFEEVVERWPGKEHARCGSRAVLFLARCLGRVAGEGWVARVDGLYVGKRREVDWEGLGEWQKGVWREWEEFKMQFGGGAGKSAKGKSSRKG